MNSNNNSNGSKSNWDANNPKTWMSCDKDDNFNINLPPNVNPDTPGFWDNYFDKIGFFKKYGNNKPEVEEQNMGALNLGDENKVRQISDQANITSNNSNTKSSTEFNWDNNQEDNSGYDWKDPKNLNSQNGMIIASFGFNIERGLERHDEHEILDQDPNYDSEMKEISEHTNFFRNQYELNHCEHETGLLANDFENKVTEDYNNQKQSDFEAGC